MRSLFFARAVPLLAVMCVCFFVLIKKGGARNGFRGRLQVHASNFPPCWLFQLLCVSADVELLHGCCWFSYEFLSGVQSKKPSDWDWDALKPHFKLKIPSHSRFLHCSRWWTTMNMMKDETTGSWIFVSSQTHNTVHSWSSTTRHRTTFKCDELCCVLSSIKLMIFLRFTRCWWLVRTTMIFPFTFSSIVICRVALRLSILTWGFAFDNCKLHTERVNDATRVKVTDWEFIL